MGIQGLPGHPTGEPPTREHTDWRECVAVGAVALLLSLPFAWVGFTTTDIWPLIESSRIGAPADLLALFAQPLGAGTEFTSEVGKHYRPIVALSFALDYAIWGLDAGGYHLTNQLLHGLVVGALYGVARGFALPRWAALLACIVFSLHPVVLATVPGLSRRQDILSLAFGLATLLSLRAGRLWFSALAFACACLAKESALALIPTVPYFLLASQGNRLTARSLRRALTATATLLIPSVLAIAARLVVLGGLAGYGTAEVPSFAAVEGYRSTLLEFLAALLWPLPTLDPGYGVSIIQHATLLLVLIAVVGILAAPQSRWALAAAVVWILSYAALYSLLRVMAPWNLYAATAGFGLLVGIALASGFENLRTRKFISAPPLVATALLAILIASPLNIVAAFGEWSEVGRITTSYLADTRACLATLSGEGPVLVAHNLPLMSTDAQTRTKRIYGATGLLPFSLEAYMGLLDSGKGVRVVKGIDEPSDRFACVERDGAWHLYPSDTR